jgi:superfamily II DNA or RNA helicase/HKD family nuclease
MGKFSQEPPDGLYEDVISGFLDEKLRELQIAGRLIDRAPLDKEGSPSYLARMVYEALEIALRSRQGEEALKEQLDIVNGVLQFIAEKTRGTFRPGETTIGQELLLSIASKAPLADVLASITRPLTPLSEAALLVNDGKHSLLPELLSEVASADRIDLICSFIKMTGFVKMRTALREHCHKGRPLRVLTTTYLGATEIQAVEGLRELGAEVKVSYETRPTRLHAKAWLFHRNSGLGTAYVGSSNLSSSALTDGLEWNVRLPEAALPRLLQTIRSVFDRYWDDEEAGFRRYDESQKESLRAALAVAKRGGGAIRAEDVSSSDFPLYRYEPTDYQRKFLKDLEIARKVRGHTRNLLVAATGTGKTVVAALDYKRLRRDDTHRCDTLLFVAHKEEILRQSRATFRLALGDPSFGELLNKDHEPEIGRHVFASVKALANRLRSQAPDPAAFDMIIVDEVHHAAADTYKILLDTMKPRILLGLTATPERSDTKSIFELFDHPWAAELRIGEAIESQLLVPFNYFSIDAEEVDLRTVKWVRGRGYDQAELSGALCAHRIWGRKIAEALAAHVADPTKIVALAFCVDVAHAQLIAEQLNQAGIPATAITGEHEWEERREAIRGMVSGAAKCPRVLCVIEIFNEGVDIPEVDTILLLRPTQSATLFIQQLGRGLRRCENKSSLTVLDFVAIQHDDFRFESRYQALLGIGRGELRRSLKHGFVRLPSGCCIEFQEKSREQVLRSLERNVSRSLASLGARLGSYDRDLTLPEFLALEELELEEIYRKGQTWTAVRQKAGKLAPSTVDKLEEDALHNIQKLTHINDALRLGIIERLAKGDVQLHNEAERRCARMCFGLLYGLDVASKDEGALALWKQHSVLKSEVLAILPALKLRQNVGNTPGGLQGDVPLRLHGRYLTDEIMVAVNHRSKEGELFRPQGGVVLNKTYRYDLLLTTLDKSEKSKTPHLQYEDRVLGPRRFQWQSQAGTRRDSETGRRHTSHNDPSVQVTPVMFVRELETDERNLAVPYFFLGPARCVRAEGERPITITWDLDFDMPEELLLAARAAVA